MIEEKYEYNEIECSYNDDFVKCPYCGFEDYDVYDGLNLYATIMGCPSCGKDFGVSIEQKIEFSSFPLDKEEE